MKKILELSEKEEERAKEIHQKAIVVNGLEAIIPKYIDKKYFLKLKQGGVNVINDGCTVMPWMRINDSEFWQWLEEIDHRLAENRDNISFVTTVDDIKKAKKQEKVAIIFGCQDLSMIDKDIKLLMGCYRLGFRIMGLAYQYRNSIADGCGERTNAGLSKSGIKAVEEMNKLGIVIDLSHVGIASTMDAMEITKDPVIFSHSCVSSLKPHMRNLNDEQIKFLAEKRGVVGIAAMSEFLVQSTDPSKIPFTTIEDYMDHIDYIVKLVGVNHVGVGLDIGERFTLEDWHYIVFDKYPELHPILSEQDIKKQVTQPQGLKSVTDCLNITRGLVTRGYSNQEIEKILGGNFLRVFKKVWGR
ncbi:MAG: dipeptidase [Candidatus Hodarchaeota archaeon]